MAEKRKYDRRSEDKFHKAQIRMLFSFIIVLVVFLLVATMVMTIKSKNILQNKVMDLLSANNSQQVINVNEYMDNVEDVVALMFSNSQYCDYDATDEFIDEFETIQKQNIVKKRIQDLGVMENFSDFCVVYGNDKVVGWLSNSISDSFLEGGLYNTLEAKISDELTGSGWFYGLGNYYDRLCYVKRLNSNAVVFASFYSRELSSVFDTPDELEGMKVYLVDGFQNIVIYSGDLSEIGRTLQKDISFSIRGKGNCTVVNGNYIVTCSACDNGWRVVCTMPKDTVLKENDNLQMFAFGICLVMILIGAIVSVVVWGHSSRRMTGEMTALTDKAEKDLLSGLRNKMSFTQTVIELLPSVEEGTICGFVMFDLDNFKKVNDTLGHDKGDLVIARFSKILHEVCEKEMLVGRMGGDEFSAYIDFGETTEGAARGFLANILEEVMKRFAVEFKYEMRRVNLSVSIGAFVTEGYRKKFDDMYKGADTALYHSKQNGKNCYTFDCDV